MSLFDLPFEEPDETLDNEDIPPPAPQRRILTVSELTGELRRLLEDRFFEIWVEGELSNCKVWNTGHLYFTLKDANAQIKGVMFRSSLRLLRFKPQDGLRVVARGRISVYDPKGEYQIVCEHLEREGLGALQLAFDQLKQRLASEGLVERRAVEGDRRAAEVRLTAAGEAAFARMAAEHERWVDGLLAGIGPEEAEALCRRLDEVAKRGTA